MSTPASPGVPTNWGETLFAERARHLAKRPPAPDGAERRLLCLCEAGGEVYGLAVDALTRVMPYTPPAPLANAAPTLLGIISRGGGFALVYDLAGLLGHQIQDRAEAGHLLLLRKLRPLTALRVERVLAVTEIALLAGEEAASLPARAGVNAYGRGQDGSIISIIDIEALVEPAAHANSGG